MRTYTKKELREMAKPEDGLYYGQIWLHGPDIEPSSFDFSNYPATEVQIINIFGNDLKYLDLSPLSDFKNLKELSIRSTNLQEIDLSPLKDLQIEVISIDDSLVKEVDLTPLSYCKKLREISILCSLLQHADLKPLSNLQELEVIDFSENNIKNIDLSTISSKILKSVYINSYANFDDLVLSPLYNQSKLIELRFSCNKIGENEIINFLSNDVHVRYEKRILYIRSDTERRNPHLRRFSYKTIPFTKEWNAQTGSRSLFIENFIYAKEKERKREKEKERKREKEKE